MRVRVIRDSMRPTPAKMREKGRMMTRVAHENGGRVKDDCQKIGRGNPAVGTSVIVAAAAVISADVRVNSGAMCSGRFGIETI
jgi:hypothetical protein